MNDHATILDPTQLRAVQYHRSARIIYANKVLVRLYLCVSVYVTSAVKKSCEGIVAILAAHLQYRSL